MTDTTERSGTRTPGNLLLERIAWNAAAAAALAVMILVLLASLEWLDRLAPAPTRAEARIQVRTDVRVDEIARAPTGARAAVRDEKAPEERRTAKWP